MPGSRLAARWRGTCSKQLRPGWKAGQLGRGFGALEHMYQTQYALFSAGTLGRSSRRAGCLGTGRNAQRISPRDLPLSTLRAVTALEFEMFLGDRLLRDMDSVSMAHSLEVRVPLSTRLADGLAG